MNLPATLPLKALAVIEAARARRRYPPIIVSAPLYQPAMRTVLPVAGLRDYVQPAQPIDWMFNPPPYDFLNPVGVTTPPNLYERAGAMRLSASALDQTMSKAQGLGCGCGCNGGCANKGMGAVDLSLMGTGIVDATGMFTGMVPNWAVYGLAAFLLVPMVMGGRKFKRHRQFQRLKARIEAAD